MEKEYLDTLKLILDLTEGHTKDFVYDLKQVSEILGVSITKTRELSRRNDFPSLKIGTKKMVVASKLNEWLVNHIGEEL